jgi:hypothetical protein
MTWSDFPKSEILPKTRGLFGRMSPSGKYIASTVNEISFVALTNDPAFCQIFFPTYGFVAWYSVEERKFHPLSGADHVDVIQTNPSWSADGRWIMFTQSQSGIMLEPDSLLYILPSEGARRGKCVAIQTGSIPGTVGRPKDCVDEATDRYEQEADLQMKRMSALKGRQVEVFPDLTFVHVVTGSPDNDLVYSVIRNKELSNNSMMFKEDRRRVFADDTLTVVKGYVGSYPNAFTRIPIDQMAPTLDRYLQIKDDIGYYHFAKKFSVQRNCPCFWEEADWHNKNTIELNPIEGGLFDLYRFHRIGEKADEKIINW